MRSWPTSLYDCFNPLGYFFLTMNLRIEDKLLALIHRLKFNMARVIPNRLPTRRIGMHAECRLTITVEPRGQPPMPAAFPWSSQRVYVLIKPPKHPGGW